MKKFTFVALAVLASSGAFAVSIDICTGIAGPATAGVGSDSSGASFVRVGFTPKCSNNTLVKVDQNATALWGASGSKKGANAFLGSSNGGGISVSAACPSTGCTTTEISTALTAAAAISS